MFVRNHLSSLFSAQTRCDDLFGNLHTDFDKKIDLFPQA